MMIPAIMMLGLPQARRNSQKRFLFFGSLICIVQVTTASCVKELPDGEELPDGYQKTINFDETRLIIPEGCKERADGTVRKPDGSSFAFVEDSLSTRLEASEASEEPAGARRLFRDLAVKAVDLAFNIETGSEPELTELSISKVFGLGNRGQVSANAALMTFKKRNVANDILGCRDGITIGLHMGTVADDTRMWAVEDATDTEDVSDGDDNHTVATGLSGKSYTFRKQEEKASVISAAMSHFSLNQDTSNLTSFSLAATRVSGDTVTLTGTTTTTAGTSTFTSTFTSAFTSTFTSTNTHTKPTFSNKSTTSTRMASTTATLRLGTASKRRTSATATRINSKAKTMPAPKTGSGGKLRATSTTTSTTRRLGSAPRKGSKAKLRATTRTTSTRPKLAPLNESGAKLMATSTTTTTHKQVEMWDVGR